MKLIENMTGAQAAKFIRNHKGKIYVDVLSFAGEDMIRVPAVKIDLATTFEHYGNADGIDVFVDEAGNTVIGNTYR